VSLASRDGLGEATDYNPPTSLSALCRKPPAQKIEDKYRSRNTTTACVSGRGEVTSARLASILPALGSVRFVKEGRPWFLRAAWGKGRWTKQRWWPRERIQDWHTGEVWRWRRETFPDCTDRGGAASLSLMELHVERSRRRFVTRGTRPWKLYHIIREFLSQEPETGMAHVPFST
jgi:hypothetical protein